ncbi:MAG TPA: hypothetical protein VJN70_12355 [Gemmatimonadaceae bacterium]|nr:hypothetical protein [Gemmatimonadaceae bacterium]
MHHKRIGILVVTSVLVGACAKSPQLYTAGGEVTPSPTPANSRLLPAGSMLDFTLDQQLDTQNSRTGDKFSATLGNAVIAQDGRTMVPAGAKVWGHVSGVTQANNATQTAALVLDFDSLAFNDRAYPFNANITATNLQREGMSRTRQTARGATAGALGGGVLGAVLSGADKDRILVGAGLGAAAGTAISLGRAGEHGVLPAGSRISVQTTQSVALRQ